jgi:hypothetical protein
VRQTTLEFAAFKSPADHARLYFAGGLPPAPEPLPLWDGLPLSVLPVVAGVPWGFESVRGGGAAIGPFGTSSLAASAVPACATLTLNKKTVATADNTRLITSPFFALNNNVWWTTSFPAAL